MGRLNSQGTLLLTTMFYETEIDTKGEFTIVANTHDDIVKMTQEWPNQVICFICGYYLNAWANFLLWHFHLVARNHNRSLWWRTLFKLTNNTPENFCPNFYSEFCDFWSPDACGACLCFLPVQPTFHAYDFRCNRCCLSSWNVCAVTNWFCPCIGTTLSLPAVNTVKLPCLRLSILAR